MKYRSISTSRLLVLLLLVCALAACGGPSKREDADGPPRGKINAAKVKDAKPRPEPRARYGNHSPYEVFGKKYHVMSSAEGYIERGTASWYGKKFHGRKTSSGEVFDMYLATAAHKSLPLPTYAEVTNLNNGRKITVKVNDRGPFKDDRLIDLSYGAAARLDMLASGTAPVEVRAITFSGNKAVKVKFDKKDDNYMQFGAFSDKKRAEDLKRTLRRAGIRSAEIKTLRRSGHKLYRVVVGPLDSLAQVQALTARAIELGLERPHRVTLR